MNRREILKSPGQKLLIAGVVLLTISAIPYANADGGGVYSVHDTNRDGYLDRSEFAKFAEAKHKRSKGVVIWKFDNVDADGDNKISEQEMVNALIKNMKRKRENR